LRLIVSYAHSIIYNELAVILQLGQEIILSEKKLQSFTVFGMNDPVSIYLSILKEISAPFLNLEFTVNLVRGKFKIIFSLGINIIDQVVMRC
jgi:hypothetical protein